MLSVVSKTLEKREVYRTKIFGSLCSLCLVMRARPIYSLEYEDKSEKFTEKKFFTLAELFVAFIKVKPTLY